MPARQPDVPAARYADMFAAIGAEPRLPIVGMAARQEQSELSIPASMLSHHLERLRHEGLVAARREGAFLFYSYAECCTCTKAIQPESLGHIPS
jgi:DNA-binding transcriptional ArsR family regulator